MEMDTETENIRTFCAAAALDFCCRSLWVLKLEDLKCSDGKITTFCEFSVFLTFELKMTIRRIRTNIYTTTYTFSSGKWKIVAHNPICLLNPQFPRKKTSNKLKKGIFALGVTNNHIVIVENRELECWVPQALGSSMIITICSNYRRSKNAAVPTETSMMIPWPIYDETNVECHLISHICRVYTQTHSAARLRTQCAIWLPFRLIYITAICKITFGKRNYNTFCCWFAFGCPLVI